MLNSLGFVFPSDMNKTHSGLLPSINANCTDSISLNFSTLQLMYSSKPHFSINLSQKFSRVSDLKIGRSLTESYKEKDYCSWMPHWSQLQHTCRVSSCTENISVVRVSVPRKGWTPMSNQKEWLLLCICLDTLLLIDVQLISEILCSHLSVEGQHNVSSFPCDQSFIRTLNAVQDWAWTFYTVFGTNRAIL